MILSLDSAVVRAGWALINRVGTREVLEASGRLERLTARVVQDFAGRVLSKPGLVDLVVIEDNYFGKDVSVLKQLAQMVGRWRQVFEAAGIRTRLVNPTTWQRGLLKGLLPARPDREAFKAAAITWARSVYGVVLDTDEADAACMGTWASRDRAMRRLIQESGRLR